MGSHFKCVPWWISVATFCVFIQVNAEDKMTEADSPKDSSELDLEAQHQVSILKQINRVNDDGSYTFGYEAADGSFKIETRDVLGNVKGMFGFIDENGQLKRISYSANNSSRPGYFKEIYGEKGDKGETESDSRQTTSVPPLIYQQLVRPQAYVASGSATTESQVTTRRPFYRPTNPRVSETSSSSTSRTVDSANRKTSSFQSQHVERSESASTPRTVVIQQIPLRSRRPNEAAITTEKSLSRSTTRRIPVPAFGQHIRQPTLANFVPGGKTLNISAVDEDGKSIPVIPSSPTAVIFGQYIRIPEEVDSTTPTLKEVIPSRKPVFESDEESNRHYENSNIDDLNIKSVDEDLENREDDRNIPQGNALRRQLAEERSNIGAIYGVPVPVVRQRTLVTDDTADVYGGSGGTPRPVPTIPFRGYFGGIGRPRIVDEAALQGQYLGYGGPTRVPPPPPITYQADESSSRVTPQPDVSRVPVAVLRPTPTPPTVPNPELLAQIMQYIMAQQVQQRQYPYPPEASYRSRFTPFQVALIQMLGINLPPELLEDPYSQPNSYQARQPPQAYPPYPQQGPYEDPLYSQTYLPSSQIPYNIRRRIPYRPRPQYIPQQPQGYDSQSLPVPYPGQQPFYGSQFPIYNFVPRYIPSNPLPYDSPQVQYNQLGQESSRNSQVGVPQEYMPEEYRDAVFLRMLLAARAQQAAGATPRPPQLQERGRPLFVGQTPERGKPFYIQVPVSERPRPVYIRPDISSETPRPIYRGTEDSTNVRSTTTTSKPRTFAPMRNVQILDPITEEPTAKRSTNGTATP